MPPKKDTPTPKKEPKDVATKATGASASPLDEDGNAVEAATQMTSDDLEFVVACLTHNASNGPIPVDCNALAEKLGYKNPGSVANRIAKLKKKYKLNLSATTSSPRKAENNGNDATADGDAPKVPVTPSKNRVTKSTRGRAVAKKTPTRKPALEYREGEEEKMSDAKENAGNEAGSDIENGKEELKVESDRDDEA